MARSKIATQIYKKYVPEKILSENVAIINEILLENVDWLLKRRNGGMKQYELAKQLNLSTGALSCKMNGKTFFTIEELAKISVIFRVDLTDLFKKVKG
ncbi:MAG: helix-turn-helix transcriptional regulator [Clostridia bacterium]|nr:helix-turn-helix transcriptional regulator [Clostridia bacterium]